uniref:Uncharacterized protein n=1 Tax=Lepeophtheirus salmonis TaxID=72036 RepID=A0A0K2U4U9_LEPSM
MASEYQGPKCLYRSKGEWSTKKRLIQRWIEETASFVEEAMSSGSQNDQRLAKSVPGMGRWANLEYAVRHRRRLVCPSLSS